MAVTYARKKSPSLSELRCASLGGDAEPRENRATMETGGHGRNLGRCWPDDQAGLMKNSRVLVDYLCSHLRNSGQLRDIWRAEILLDSHVSDTIEAL